MILFLFEHWTQSNSKLLMALKSKADAFHLLSWPMYKNKHFSRLFFYPFHELVGFQYFRYIQFAERTFFLFKCETNELASVFIYTHVHKFYSDEMDVLPFMRNTTLFLPDLGTWIMNTKHTLWLAGETETMIIVWRDIKGNSFEYSKDWNGSMWKY